MRWLAIATVFLIALAWIGVIAVGLFIERTIDQLRRACGEDKET